MKNNKKIEFYYWLLAIILIGSILRTGFLLSNPSFWFDESAVLNESKIPFTKLLSGDTLFIKTHPILILVITKFWSFFSLDERWLRLPHTISSILTILVTYFILTNIFKNKNIGLIGSFLLSSSTYNIRFSGEAKVYSIAFFFQIISLFLFIKIIKELKNSKINKSHHIFFIIFSFLAVITDYSFFWLFLVYMLYIFIMFFSNLNNITFKKNVSRLFIDLTAIVILFLPWFYKVIITLPQSFSIINSYITRPHYSDLIETILAYLTFFKHKNEIAAYPSISLDSIFTNFNIYILMNIFLLVILFLAFINKSLNNKTTLLMKLLVLPLIISFLVSQRFPIFVHYNLMIVQIGIICILAPYIYKNKTIGMIILIIYISLNLYSYTHLLRYGFYSDDWRTINQYINSKKLSYNSAIVLFPGYNIQPFSYYNEKKGYSPNYNIIEINYKFTPELDLNRYLSICLISDRYFSTSKPNLTLKINNEISKYFKEEIKRGFGDKIIVSCFLKNKNFDKNV